MKNTGCLIALMLVTQFAFAVTIQPFTLQQMNAEEPGTMYSSLEQTCKVYVLESYFLNCPYCNDNAPNVDDLSSDYADTKMVEVLDIGVDKSDSQYAEWIRRHNPNHPVLKDDKKSLTSQLGTTGYPSTYIVDFTGKVVMKTSGVWSSTTKTKLRNKINSLLQRDCPISDVE
jgi:peroxiredoxin